jgi:hypothetical protein
MIGVKNYKEVQYLKMFGETKNSDAIRKLKEFLVKNVASFSIAVIKKWYDFAWVDDNTRIDLCANDPTRLVDIEIPGDDSMLIDDILKIKDISWITI